MPLSPRCALARQPYNNPTRKMHSGKGYHNRSSTATYHIWNPIQMEKFLLALCKSRWTHHYPAHSGTKCSTLDRLQQMNVASIRLEHQKVKRAASLAFLSGCCTGLAKQGLCRAYKTKVRWSLKSKKFRALKFRYKLSSSLPHWNALFYSSAGAIESCDCNARSARPSKSLTAWWQIWSKFLPEILLSWQLHALP